jgi:hypothetical protein
MPAKRSMRSLHAAALHFPGQHVHLGGALHAFEMLAGQDARGLARDDADARAVVHFGEHLAMAVEHRLPVAQFAEVDI